MITVLFYTSHIPIIYDNTYQIPSQSQNISDQHRSIAVNIRPVSTHVVNLLDNVIFSANAIKTTRTEIISNLSSQVITHDTSNLQTVQTNNKPNVETLSYSMSLNADRRIAIVEPTFTESAYNNTFYVFYNKYVSIEKYPEVTTDLNLLTAQLNKKPPSAIEDEKDMRDIQAHLSDSLSNSTITYLTDQDIEDGKIFYNNTRIAYDLIILLHEEYLTQNMYDKLKHFVSNGGKILFLDPNFFYAEVNYDKKTNTISLVKGHGWSFNGLVAKRDVSERWANDTRSWVGSNFLNIPASQKIFFSNNAFDYSHHEENIANNPNDVLLLDYDAYGYPLNESDGKVATYEAKYGNGSMIVIGLYGQDLLENSKFMLFFDNLVKSMFSNNFSTINYQIPNNASLSNTSSSINHGSSTPSIPLYLAAYPESKSAIMLSWDPPKSNGGSAILGYKIEYTSDSDHYAVLIDNTKNSETSFLDNNLVAGKTYAYRVSAINSMGIGQPSLVASATAEDIAYPRIMNISVISSTEVSLSWIPPSQTYGQQIMGYRIDQIIGGMNISLVDDTESSKNSYVISNLVPGKKYILAVTAIFSEGNSITSPTISITTNAD